MKSFNQLKSQLNEMWGDSSMSVPDKGMDKAEDGSVNIFAIENPMIVDRLNAALAYINANPTINPTSRIIEIKQSLKVAGLDFNENLVGVADGEVVEVPMTQFGGRTGMTPEEGYVNDDGISHKTGGVRYALQFRFSESEGQWAVTSLILPMELAESFNTDTDELDILEN
jgi:hypothetical protein